MGMQLFGKNYVGKYFDAATPFMFMLVLPDCVNLSCGRGHFREILLWEHTHLPVWTLSFCIHLSPRLRPVNYFFSIFSFACEFFTEKKKQQFALLTFGEFAYLKPSGRV